MSKMKLLLEYKLSEHQVIYVDTLCSKRWKLTPRLVSAVGSAVHDDLFPTSTVTKAGEEREP